MKKNVKRSVILVLTICLVVFIGAVNAYAVSSFTGTGTLGTSPNTLEVTTSNKVAICYGGASQEYTAGSDHIAGNKVFGTGSKQGIFYKAKTPGSYVCGSNLSGTSFDSSGWTAQ